MNVKINHNNDDLWCLYMKEQILIGELYIEVVEECLDEKILKTYSYGCLNQLIVEHLENYGEEPEIFGDHQ